MPVLPLNVSESQWALMTTAINRDSFNRFLVHLIAPCIKKFTDIEGNAVITLPSIVSKACRYSIHRLSTPEFKTNTYDREGNRIMEITISQVYIQNLFRYYDFNPVTEPVLTDKQVLFSNLIKFIETNLNEEFQKYLENI